MSTMTLNYEAEADRLIDTPWPGYQEPLLEVRKWVRQGGAALGPAVRALEHLRGRHPHAIKVAQELVLAYLQNRQPDAARQLLERLEREFPYKDEETLCRVGRLRRDVGDTLLQGESILDADRRQARREYDRAWERYDQAYALRAGHYPGVNRAALFLLKAWTAVGAGDRAALLQEARSAAEQLLARRSDWPVELPDDNIWHLATEAEALLLVGGWDRALPLYRRTVAQDNYSDFYRESIGGEVRRLLRPLRELLSLPETTAGELQALFPPAVPPAAA